MFLDKLTLYDFKVQENKLTSSQINENVKPWYKVILVGENDKINIELSGM